MEAEPAGGSVGSNVPVVRNGTRIVAVANQKGGVGSAGGAHDPCFARLHVTSERDLAHALKRVSEYLTARADEAPSVTVLRPNPPRTRTIGRRGRPRTAEIVSGGARSRTADLGIMRPGTVARWSGSGPVGTCQPLKYRDFLAHPPGWSGSVPARERAQNGHNSGTVRVPTRKSLDRYERQGKTLRILGLYVGYSTRHLPDTHR